MKYRDIEILFNHMEKFFFNHNLTTYQFVLIHNQKLTFNSEYMT